MTQRGPHTWDLVIQYHKCPSCGYIMESREGYRYRLGEYLKDLECPRCHKAFTIKKNIEITVGPIFGEGKPCEMEWRIG